MKTDPRFGAPSASSFYRHANCPASFLLGKQAVEQGICPPAGDDATSGTRIHRWLETNDIADFAAMTIDEQGIAETCQFQADAILKEYECTEVFRELRLGCNSFGIVSKAKAGDVFTGQADVIGIGENCVVVIDYKTGRGDVEDAVNNKQIAALTALAALYKHRKEAIGCIVQPLAGKPSVAKFDADALRSNLNQAIDQAEYWAGDEPKPAIAGDWCQYCPARAACGSFAALAIKDAEEFAINSPESMLPAALSLSPDRLATLLKGRKAIGWYLHAIEAAARIKLENGEIVPGFELRERAGKRKITDPAEASQRIAPLLAGAAGGSSAAIIRCATLSAKQLTDEVQIASGKKDGRGYNMTAKAAKDAVAEVLGDLIETTTSRILCEIDEKD